MKHHDEPKPRGLIRLLFAEDDHGFIQDGTGRDIYFHRNSLVSGDFDRLEVGTAVRFVEEAGNEGPQASTVEVMDA